MGNDNYIEGNVLEDKIISGEFGKAEEISVSI